MHIFCNMYTISAFCKCSTGAAPSFMKTKKAYIHKAKKVGLPQKSTDPLGLSINLSVYFPSSAGASTRAEGSIILMSIAATSLR